MARRKTTAVVDAIELSAGATRHVGEVLDIVFADRGNLYDFMITVLMGEGVHRGSDGYFGLVSRYPGRL